MNKWLLVAALISLYPDLTNSQQFSYSGNLNKQGITVIHSSAHRTTLAFAIESWTLNEVSINRQPMQQIELPGHFLPNDEGMPDLPGSGRFIAIPRGSVARLEITGMQTEVLQNIDLAPAPRIPKTTENEPLFYARNEGIYNTNSFYPAEPVKLSAPTQIRGVDVVMLGITPFQYNPVTKELIVLRNIEVEVIFEGGDGRFGDDRLRSRWWEPVLSDMVVNYNQITAPTLTPSHNGGKDGEGAEYLIICPNDPAFLAWADTIRTFRNKQGISTRIVTTSETGGNTVTAIKNYINNAYNTWDIPPVAILIMGDYGASGSTVISPIWEEYCASDNIFADVNDDDLPDIVISRIMGQNASQLEIMIDKFIGYETNPPVSPDYYNHPITALGWQTERWFQICIEVVGGFFKNVLGKEPVRINAVYGGNPNFDPWSTAPNTGAIMNYFGPEGLGYIPSSPTALGNWNGGNSTHLNNAINNGSFLLLHRDHGFEQGWGEPDYTNSHLSGLNNDDLTFVYSVNCLTGKFNIGSECFAEAFYRHPKRALGIIAASEVSYSFVNDTYVWGAFDNMWPEFMPEYGSNPEPRGLLPAFSNAAGKYFLQQSGWPYNSGNKEVTFHLFHHFGDAFMTLYSEVPRELLVLHNTELMGGASEFIVNAEEQSLIALSVDGEIIGVAEGTGSPLAVDIIQQDPGTIVDIVVTKTNCFRYENTVNTISPDVPYVVYDSHQVNDQDGNGNGQMDYAETSFLSLTLKNLGNRDAENVTVYISTEDPYMLITDSTESAGDIEAGGSLLLTDAFSVTVADSIPEGHIVIFNVRAGQGDSISWHSAFFITAHAPVLQLAGFTVTDPEGNNNGKIDPGELANIHITITNTGTADAFNVTTELSYEESYLTILTGSQYTESILPGGTTDLTFNVTADENTPGGLNATITVDITAENNISGHDSFSCVIGDYTALVLDLDPLRFSGPAFLQAFYDLGFFADYSTTMMPDLSTYRNVFVCLGTHFTNHILTESEASVLADFLGSGGNLYMEGLLTWHDDPQTSVHPMFNISPVFTNYYKIDTVYNRPGAFTENMKFRFLNQLPYCNHQIHSVAPAFEIFSFLPDSLPSAVAYDAVDYKTIGSAFQFAGLTNSEHPSTRKELLARFLAFFGETITITDDPASDHITRFGLITYPNPFSDAVTFHFKLEKPSRVILEIFNNLGKLENVLIDSQLDNGPHQVTWKLTGGDRLNANGMYFYRFVCGDEIQGGKIIFAE
jgi:hypothetical protein